MFEVLSFGGYVVLFRTVFVRGDTRIDWRASYQITMAGLAATRLFAAGRRRRHRADRVGAAALGHGARGSSRAGWSPSSSLLYAVYMLALVI